MYAIIYVLLLIMWLLVIRKWILSIPFYVRIWMNLYTSNAIKNTHHSPCLTLFKNIPLLFQLSRSTNLPIQTSITCILRINGTYVNILNIVSFVGLALCCLSRGLGVAYVLVTRCYSWKTKFAKGTHYLFIIRTGRDCMTNPLKYRIQNRSWRNTNI